MPKGQTDPNLTHFSIKHDEAYIIPVLKQALQVNPNIKIMATPWSPPGWMKSTDSMEGGTLNPDAYASYANYFVKFIQAYQAQGIPIYVVTVQNEPLYQPVGYPGMSFPATQEANFIANYLAPAFAANKITTKILGYDHNWDQPGYPTTLLSDTNTNAALAGTAWHCYAGAVEAQTQVRNAYPNKDTYETACSGGQWEGNNGLSGTANLLIGVTRNWGKSVVRWGMALDPNGQPNLGTGAACSQCRGVVTIDQNNGNVTYNGDYYGLGQASKFLTPGAYRIDSSAGSNGIIDSAFKNSDGSKVLVVYNSAASQQSFDVQWGGQWFTYTLPAGAIATFKWSGTQTAGGGSGVVALDRSGWSATASVSNVGEPPSNALDGTFGTRWSTGQPQSPGISFQVDMANVQSFSSIALDCGASGGDYPRGYQVFVSNDGSTWGNAIASGQGSSGYTVIPFTKQSARYIKVVLTASLGSWWSIDEFYAFS
jgi:glucosylceramidase